MVLLADSPKQSVMFYMALDDYPLVYQTDLTDTDEMLELRPDHASYRTAEGYFGTYYVRVRPSYDLADLFREGSYSYYLRAFGQPAGYGQTDLYHDMEVAGIASAGNNAFYRHYITDAEHIIRVKLFRLAGKGLPMLMVKLTSNREIMTSAVRLSYDQKIELNEDVWSVEISMDKQWRASEGHPDCDYASYWQDGGSDDCVLYMAVECQESEEMCGFKISLTLETVSETTGEVEPISLTPARYIPKDQDYVDAVVPFRDISRFYYPIKP